MVTVQIYFYLKAFKNGILENKSSMVIQKTLYSDNQSQFQSLESSMIYFLVLLNGKHGPEALQNTHVPSESSEHSTFTFMVVFSIIMYFW